MSKPPSYGQLTRSLYDFRKPKEWLRENYPSIYKSELAKERSNFFAAAADTVATEAFGYGLIAGRDETSDEKEPGVALWSAPDIYGTPIHVGDRVATPDGIVTVLGFICENNVKKIVHRVACGGRYFTECADQCQKIAPDSKEEALQDLDDIIEKIDNTPYDCWDEMFSLKDSLDDVTRRLMTFGGNDD